MRSGMSSRAGDSGYGSLSLSTAGFRFPALIVYIALRRGYINITTSQTGGDQGPGVFYPQTSAAIRPD